MISLEADKLSSWCLLLWFGLVTGADSKFMKELKNICPPDWKFTGTHCYKLLPERKSFREAQGACLDDHRGAHLPIIRTSKESEAFRHYWRLRPGIACGKGPWIGLSDKGSQGTWSTVNNEGAVFYDWASDVPTISTESGAVCVHDYVEIGGWNDISCDEKLHVVCQLPVKSDLISEMCNCPDSTSCDCIELDQNVFLSCQTNQLESKQFNELDESLEEDQRLHYVSRKQHYSQIEAPTNF